MTSHDLGEGGKPCHPQMVDLSKRVLPNEQWVATLAHELRQPLTAVVMALEELRPACVNDPAASAMREAARDGAGHMARVIEDVLELCSYRLGKLPLQTERIEFSKVVTGAIRNVQPILVAKNHHLAVSLPANPLTLEANASRFEQILTNLLANAADNTQQGGRISLSAESAAGVLTVRIRDNGVGISHDLLPYVFEMYRQRSFPRPSHRNGLGIGLALVKTLAELHGGTIEARSDGRGTGSEFIVRLPCVVSGESARDSDFFG